MAASTGLTKKSKVPAPPPMSRPGLAVSRETARLGIGPLRRVIEPWTRPPDDIATSSGFVGARNRGAFPLSLPMLSANGARAGLGPDRTGPDSSGAGNDVPTRPDAALSRPAMSRVGADIGTAVEVAQARALGLDKPPPPPELSLAGARAGLGPFAKGSATDTARANAMANVLAQSISQIRTNARALLGQASTSIAPIQPLSDSSSRAGLSGSAPTAAASKGFSMRVPKSPVAQDRERWASGTQARIAGASKGLGLAKSDWADHYASAKPQPKRTWVGVQGDATENPFDTGACSDLALPPHAAVNKSAPLRELEKERVPSDVCPPLQSSVGILESILSRDARLAAVSPARLFRRWASRPALLRPHTGPTGPATSFKPRAPTGKEFQARGDCGCWGCGCKDNSQANRPHATTASRRMNGMQGPPSRAGARLADQEIRALLESFALRHGKDANAEWFVPLFRRMGRLTFGAEQQGPISHPWRPDATLGMTPGDKLVATIHTHARSAEFSEEDKMAGEALGVPMVLVAPGAERARVYDSESQTVQDVLALGNHANQVTSRPIAWKSSAKFSTPGTTVFTSALPHQSGLLSADPHPQRATHGGTRDITISAPPPSGGLTASIPAFYFSTGALQMRHAVATLPKQPIFIDEDVLARTVQLAADNTDAAAELIWMQLTLEAAQGKLRVTVIPDPDLFRAIVGVAQRDSPASRDVPDTVLDVAK